MKRIRGPTIKVVYCLMVTILLIIVGNYLVDQATTLNYLTQMQIDSSAFQAALMQAKILQKCLWAMIPVNWFTVFWLWRK